MGRASPLSRHREAEGLVFTTHLQPRWWHWLPTLGMARFSIGRPELRLGSGAREDYEYNPTS